MARGGSSHDVMNTSLTTSVKNSSKRPNALNESISQRLRAEFGLIKQRGSKVALAKDDTTTSSSQAKFIDATVEAYVQTGAVYSSSSTPKPQQRPNDFLRK